VKTPFLSITIPTYNRALRLEQCLLMLLSRIAELSVDSPLIEVQVVDNASSDETAAVARKYADRFSHFNYTRNESNLGIDGNIHRCTQIAKGRWVQLLSDDDILLPGALSTIVDRLIQHDDADFLFLNVVSFTDSLPKPNEYLPRIQVKQDLVCSDQNLMMETCHIWLTFLSSFVFRRDAWNRSPSLESYIGSDIYLSYALVDLLSNAKKTIVVAQPLVAARAHFSGSYRIFYAFGYHWTELLTCHAPLKGFNYERMRLVLMYTVRNDLLLRVVHYRINGCELTKEDRNNVFHSVQRGTWLEFILWIAVTTPQKLFNVIIAILRKTRNMLKYIIS
jgi:abequosyltransferase